MLAGFVQIDGMLYAGAIAYFALLSLFQLAVLGVVMVGQLLGEATARQVMIDQIVEYTPLTTEDAVDITEAVLAAHAGLGLVAVPLLVLGGIGLFFAVQRGVSRAFFTTPRGNVLREQVLNLGLMGLAGLLFAASLVFGVVVGLIQAGIEAVEVPGSWLLVWGIGLVVPFGLAFVALILIYRFVPQGEVRVRHVWPAALLAAVAWTILQALLSLYATRIADYANILGPISSAVTLVVFMFASAVIVLLGASLAHAWLVDERTESLPSEG